MVNLLIVEDDIIQFKHLINIISSNIEDIRLYNMSITGKEAIKIIDNENIDIIILDLNLPEMSGIEILSYIADNNIEKYENSIIVVSGDLNLINQLPLNSYIYLYSIIQKPVFYEDLVQKISEIVTNKTIIKKEDIVKSKINQELEYLKFNFSHNGTRYLAETIFELYKNRTGYLDNFKRDIFPVLAKRHNKTVNTIEGNIKQAINYMFFNCNENVLKDYFHYSYIMKPKLKEISFIIFNKLAS